MSNLGTHTNDQRFAPMAKFSNKTVAYMLHKVGLPIFPTQETGDIKKPYPGVMWATSDTRSKAWVDACWEKYPDAAPAIDVGKADLLVIDCDEGLKGIQAWEAICAQHGGFDAPYVETPSGGRHIYVRQPEGQRLGNSRGSLPPKTDAPIDVRGDGGYVVAGGASTEAGDYTPSDGDFLSVADAPACPDWLVEILSNKPSQKSALPRHNASGGSVSAPQIDADHPRIREYVDSAFREEIRSVAQCMPGGRNEQLNKAAFSLFQLAAAKWSGISAAQVEAALYEAAEECGLVADGPGEVRRTIASGRRAGMSNPREMPEEIAWDIADEQESLERGGRLAAQLLEGSLKTPQEPEEAFDPETGEVMELEPNGTVSDVPDLLQGIELGSGTDWMEPDGLIGEIARWISATARWPNKPLSIAGALATVAAPLMRHMHTPSGSSLNIYMIMLAGTAIGKGAPLKAPQKILKEAQLSMLAVTLKTFSVSGLEELICEHPGCIASCDEIGPNLLRKIFHKRANSHEQAMKTPLMEIWSRTMGGDEWTTTKRAQGDVQTITSAGLSILGASTPVEFFESVGGNSITDGFMNRFLIVNASERGQLNDDVPDNIKNPPQHIVNTIKSLVPGGAGPLSGGVGTYYPTGSVTETRVSWASDEVRLAMREFTLEMTRRLDADTQYGGAVARAAEYVERLATIHAIGRDGLKARVEMRDLHWAAAFVMSSARAVIEGAQEVMSTSAHHTQLNNIKAAIRKVGKIRERDLSRKFQGITTNDFKNILRQLEEMGYIAVAPGAKGKSGPAPKFVKWIE